MATRTALLNGNAINRDTDFSKYIEAVSEAGVISGFTVTSSSVAIGKAFVPCERTNGDTIYAVVYNISAQSISGNGDVYIEISQELIDNGELTEEDGTGIAEIKVGTLPAKNALLLATITSGVVEDKRNMIKKVGELLEMINTNSSDISDLDTRVNQLEVISTINHLEESSLVGELYTLNDVLFKQYTPTLTNSTLDINVGDDNANKEIHIQRIGSGVASNELKLKVKMVGSSTQNLIVEVRKGVQVTVTEDSEAYWYGGEVIASGSINYSDISSSYAEKTVTLNANFGGTKGELLDIVVYMSTVNISNYYCVACDETQTSEGLSYVSVNGDTRTRGYLVPYCISDGFTSTVLAKQKDKSDYVTVPMNNITVLTIANDDLYDSYSTKKEVNWVATASGTFSLTISFQGSNDAASNFHINVNGIGVYSSTIRGTGTTCTATFSCFKGDKVRFYISDTGSSYYMYNHPSADVVQTGIYVFTPQDIVKILPQEVKALGEFGVGTIYGEHPNDGKFYGGIMLEKDTVVLTGNIVPGNFVGYIKVSLNGEIIKIPYYS